jgi:tetratricopeptide (TPR) repeat protein
MAQKPPATEDTSAARWEIVVATGDQTMRQGRFAEAERAYRAALQMAEQWGPDDERMVTSLWKLGQSLHAQKQHPEGEQLRRRALELQEARLGPDDRQVADLLYGLALDYSNMRKPAEGVPLMERALAITEQVYGSDHEEAAKCLAGLGVLFNNARRLPEAAAVLRRALTIYERGGERHDSRAADTLEQLARLVVRDGQLGEAEALYQRALTLREQAEGPEGYFVGSLLLQIARFYAQDLHRMVEAEQLHRRALAIYEKTPGKDSPQALSCRYGLAALCHAQGRWGEADNLLRENIRLYEQAEVAEYWAAPHQINLASSLSLLATVCCEQGAYREAELLLQRALAIKEERMGPEHPHVAWLLEQYSRVLQVAGQLAEAGSLEARAQGILAKSGALSCCGIDRAGSG